MRDSLVRHDVIDRLSDRLYRAEIARTSTSPLTEEVDDLSLQEAYAIQQANIDRRKAEGYRVIGHKIGLTAKTMQELFGVNEPDYGHLMDYMMHDESHPLDMSRLIDPQVEVEPAFILKTDLMGPDLKVDDVLDATDYIVPCFEIIDSRITDWRIRLQDTVADNGSSALVILGSNKVGPRDFDLTGLHTTLQMDGKVVEEGNTTAILGHPANGIAWLANTISAYGVGLKAGDIVLPGTCTRSYRMGGHTTTTGTIEKLGSVTLNLVGSPTVVRG